MTENTNETTEPVAEEATVPTPELPVFATGFMVLKSEAGSWHVLTDIKANIDVLREADINEVRQGASEVVYGIANQQVAASVLQALMSQAPVPATQEETESTIKE